MEIEKALRGLSPHDRWQIAHWLLEDLETNGHAPGGAEAIHAPTVLPDYAARRRRIFGEKVLPNLVLVARDEERW
jgi:hypothetical protein